MLKVHLIAKIRFGCWVAPSRPPRPPTRTGLRFAQSGWSGPGRPAIVWPDFASKVRLGRQGRPVEASGLRPSALASRPPALIFLVVRYSELLVHKQGCEPGSRPDALPAGLVCFSAEQYPSQDNTRVKKIVCKK